MKAYKVLEENLWEILFKIALLMAKDLSTDSYYLTRHDGTDGQTQAVFSSRDFQRKVKRCFTHSFGFLYNFHVKYGY